MPKPKDLKTLIAERLKDMGIDLGRLEVRVELWMGERKLVGVAYSLSKRVRKGWQPKRPQLKRR